MKRIVLTGGGTAGHVTPNLSLIPRLIAAGYDVHYIGTEHGIERGMIAQVPGVTYHVVQSGKLRRYFSLQNFTDPFRVLHGAFTSVSLMRRLKPDVCFSKGGFVGVPVVIGHYWRAWQPSANAVAAERNLFPPQPYAWHGAKRNVFCVDFSIGASWRARKFPEKYSPQQFRLAALRWPEKVLVTDNGDVAATE